MELCFPLRFCKVKTMCAEKNTAVRNLQPPGIWALSRSICGCRHSVWASRGARCGWKIQHQKDSEAAKRGTAEHCQARVSFGLSKVGIICSCQKHRTAAKLLTTLTQPTRDQIRLNEAVVWPSAVCSVGSGPGEAILPGLLSQMQICLLTRLQINHYTLTSGTPCFNGEGHHLTQSNSNSWCFYLFRCWFFFLLKLF